jgi:hypothetical protein
VRFLRRIVGTFFGLANPKTRGRGLFMATLAFLGS